MKRRHFSAALGSAATTFALPILSLMPTSRALALGEIKISLDDSSKRFLQFYEAANTAASPPQADASAPVLPAALPDEAGRWALYKQLYDVNPRNLDEAKLREEFNAAWPKYKAALETIRSGFNALNPNPADVLGKIGGALRMDASLALRFIAYVGTFSGQVTSGAMTAKSLNADGSTQDGAQPFVAFEMESYANGGDKALTIAMANLCILNAGYNKNQDNTLAYGIISNGVSMQLARLGLGLSTLDTLFGPAGVSSATRSPDTLRALRNKLQAPATNASESELRYAGALVVERWYARGLSIPEILRTPKEQLVKVTGAMLDTIIKK
jgi:hypothetical protein